MDTIWEWFKARVSEPSTWAGIAAAAGSIAASLSSGTGLAVALVAALVAVVKAEQ